ncbi:hypothetical protein ACWKT5_32805 [Streptomyces avermitilis]
MRLADCVSRAGRGGSLTTTDDFADLTPDQFVEAVVSGSIYPYTEHRIPKRRDGLRTLHAPVSPVSEMQQEILARLETLPASFQPHQAAFAYRRGRPVVDCAATHLRAHTVIRLDIADFFGIIRERHVHASLKAELDADVPGLLPFAQRVEPGWAEIQLRAGSGCARFRSTTNNR